MLKILYIADPNSIHDIKWMKFFANKKTVAAYLLPRKSHLFNYSKSKAINDITLLGYIDDFSIVRFYNNILTAFRIRNLIKKNHIELIHIQYAEPNALWCIFRFFFNVPMIITCRGTDVLKTIPEAFEKKSLLNYFVGFAYKRAFKLADWVTGTSERQLESIKCFSNRKKRLSIIRTGVERQLYQADTSNHFPLQNNKPYILFPRYIRPLYNHEFCLDAIELLSNNIKANYKMVFVGRDEGDMAYQKILTDQMENISEVEFEFIKKQSQKSIIELYKRASLVVMTPKSDGSPVSAMEALLSNKQVILGPLEYDKEIFSENVVQLDCWNSVELSDKIGLTLGSLDNKISEKVSQLMDRTYNMNKMKDIYLSLIDETTK